MTSYSYNQSSSHELKASQEALHREFDELAGLLTVCETPLNNMLIQRINNGNYRGGEFFSSGLGRCDSPDTPLLIRSMIDGKNMPILVDPNSPDQSSPSVKDATVSALVLGRYLPDQFPRLSNYWKWMTEKRLGGGSHLTLEEQLWFSDNKPRLLESLVGVVQKYAMVLVKERNTITYDFGFEEMLKIVLEDIKSEVALPPCITFTDLQDSLVNGLNSSRDEVIKASGSVALARVALGRIVTEDGLAYERPRYFSTAINVLGSVAIAEISGITNSDIDLTKQAHEKTLAWREVAEKADFLIAEAVDIKNIEIHPPQRARDFGNYIKIERKQAGEFVKSLLDRVYGHEFNPGIIESELKDLSEIDREYNLALIYESIYEDSEIDKISAFDVVDIADYLGEPFASYALNRKRQEIRYLLSPEVLAAKLVFEHGVRLFEVEEIFDTVADLRDDNTDSGIALVDDETKCAKLQIQDVAFQAKALPNDDHDDIADADKIRIGMSYIGGLITQGYGEEKARRIFAVAAAEKYRSIAKYGAIDNDESIKLEALMGELVKLSDGSFPQIDVASFMRAADNAKRYREQIR